MTANPAFAPLRGTGCRLFSGTRYKRAQTSSNPSPSPFKERGPGGEVMKPARVTNARKQGPSQADYFIVICDLFDIWCLGFVIFRYVYPFIATFTRKRILFHDDTT